MRFGIRIGLYAAIVSHANMRATKRSATGTVSQAQSSEKPVVAVLDQAREAQMASGSRGTPPKCKRWKRRRPGSTRRLALPQPATQLTTASAPCVFRSRIGRTLRAVD